MDQPVHFPALSPFPSSDDETAGQILDIPVFATTQNRARLGETCSELRLDVAGGFATKIHADKTMFSMW